MERTLSATDLSNQVSIPAATVVLSGARKYPSQANISTMPVSFQYGSLQFHLTDPTVSIHSIQLEFCQYSASDIPFFNIMQGTMYGTVGIADGFFGLDENPAIRKVVSTPEYIITADGIKSFYVENTEKATFGWQSITVMTKTSSKQPVTSISTNFNDIYLKIGETSKVVTATALPATASNQTLEWQLFAEGSERDVATFNQGTKTINALKAGEASLRVMSLDGNYCFKEMMVYVYDAYAIRPITGLSQSDPFSPSAIKAYLNDDGKLMTYNTLTQIYAQATNQLRFGKNKVGGLMELAVPSNFKVSKVIMYAQAAGDGATSVRVNNGTSQTISSTSLNYYVFDISTPLNTVTIANSYVSGTYGTLFIEEMYLVKVAKTNTELIWDFVNGYMHTEIPYTTSSSGNNACLSYYAPAKAAFNALTPTQRDQFLHDYNFSKPCARLMAWATANGDVLDENDLLVARSSNYLNIFENTNHSIAIIMIISAASLVALGAFFFIRKKKRS